MWPQARVHYFFAASGNDSFARMALGYRHMQGLGVPRSCQTAVLYYQPVAEEVVELAQTPDSLPFVSIPPIPSSGLPCISAAQCQRSQTHMWGCVCPSMRLLLVMRHLRMRLACCRLET